MPEPFAALVKEDAEEQQEQLDIPQPHLEQLVDLDLRLRNDPAVLLGLVRPATIPQLITKYIQSAANLHSD